MLWHVFNWFFPVVPHSIAVPTFHAELCFYPKLVRQPVSTVLYYHATRLQFDRRSSLELLYRKYVVTSLVFL